MKPVVTAKQMQMYDSYTIEKIGIPSLVLMERAAERMASEIRKRFSKPSRALIVAGCGNNGGDGFAVGRILQEYGWDIDCILAGSEEKCSRETKRQIEIVKRLGIPVREVIDRPEAAFLEKDYTVIVDALFGIGLSRRVEGIYEKIVEEINDADGFVVSVDIPSGVHADTGEIMGCAVKADMTVTFAYLKMGHVLYPGSGYVGELIVGKIGIGWQAGLPEPEAFCYEKSDFARIPARDRAGNKGTFGRALVIAGSKDMCGACELAALAAYRSGAGLVKVFTAKENREILLRKIPELILSVYGEDICEQDFKKELDWADCVLLGPGLGTGVLSEKITQFVCRYCDKPLIIDADGLNILAGHEEWLEKLRDVPVVLTPHMGEFARLTKKSIKCCKEEGARLVKQYAGEKNVCLVRKDARTLVSSKGANLYVNISGNNGMATGGSGDVLAGILAGFLAQGMDLFDAACLGVYIHGAAGDRAAEEKTPYAMLAGDIIEKLPSVFAEGITTDTGERRQYK